MDKTYKYIKKNGREKRERENKNKYLKEHAYTWCKEAMYVAGYMDGDFKEVWVLRGENGKKVKDVEDLLHLLNYYNDKEKYLKEKEERRLQKAADEE